MAVGVYPGTFDPPTVAHLAIAEAALTQGGLDRLELVVSEAPLGKGNRVSPLSVRLRLLEAVASRRPWMSVRVAEGLLVAEIAAGYDAVVLGADKWQQVIDPDWYGGSRHRRDEAVASLPRVLLAPRHGVPVGSLPAGALILGLAEEHRQVSASAVRAGRRDWAAPEIVDLWLPPGR